MYLFKEFKKFILKISCKHEKKFFFKNLFRLLKNKSEFKFIFYFLNYSLTYFLNEKKLIIII